MREAEVPPLGSRDRDRPAMVSPAADPTSRLPGVLIVDDDESVRRVLAAGLSRQGFAVWQAADSREAVELYRTHHPAIGVVLLDVRMPGRDGPATLAALQEVDPHVRACFMTGDAGHYTERDLLDLGALVVYRKPPDMGEMSKRLAQIAFTSPGDGPRE